MCLLHEGHLKDRSQDIVRYSEVFNMESFMHADSDMRLPFPRLDSCNAILLKMTRNILKFYSLLSDFENYTCCIPAFVGYQITCISISRSTPTLHLASVYSNKFKEN